MDRRLKNLIRTAVYKSFSNEIVLGYLRGKRLQGKITVLMYHEIAGDADDIEAWTVVKRSDFVTQMAYLKEHFDVLSLGEALSSMRGANPGKGAKPKAVVTFDDGYSGNGLLPSIIEEMEVPVTVFIATMAVQDRTLYWYDRLIGRLQSRSVMDLDLSHLSLGKYSINRTRGAENWAEIERLLSALKSIEPKTREAAVEKILELLDGFPEDGAYNFSYLTIEKLGELARSPFVTIGAHSHCHGILTQLGKSELSDTIMTSKNLLEAWLARQVKYFAYPSGKYNPDVIEAVKKAGFECALTTVSGLWGSDQPPLTIPRVGIGRYDSFDCFKVKVTGGLKYSEGPFL